MTKFITINTSYQEVEIALFFNDKLIDKEIEANKSISKCFIFLLENILQKNKASIKEIDFIATNIGPAPLTTLRVSLAFVNGLAETNNIPIIGINNLELLAKENILNKNSDDIVCQYSVVLLNAFCQDVYFGIYDNQNDNYEQGCSEINNFLNNLPKQINQKVCFSGNGALMHIELIKSIFNDNAMILKENNHASIESIAHYALNLWKLNLPKQYSVMPIYLKSAV